MTSYKINAREVGLEIENIKSVTSQLVNSSNSITAIKNQLTKFNSTFEFSPILERIQNEMEIQQMNFAKYAKGLSQINQLYNQTNNKIAGHLAEILSSENGFAEEIVSDHQLKYSAPADVQDAAKKIIDAGRDSVKLNWKFGDLENSLESLKSTGAQIFEESKNKFQETTAQIHDYFEKNDIRHMIGTNGINIDDVVDKVTSTLDAYESEMKNADMYTRISDGCMQYYTLKALKKMVSGAVKIPSIVGSVSGANEFQSGFSDMVCLAMGAYDQVDQHEVLQEIVERNGAELGKMFGNEAAGKMGVSTLYNLGMLLDPLSSLDEGAQKAAEGLADILQRKPTLFEGAKNIYDFGKDIYDSKEKLDILFEGVTDEKS